MNLLLRVVATVEVDFAEVETSRRTCDGEW